MGDVYLSAKIGYELKHYLVALPITPDFRDKFNNVLTLFKIESSYADNLGFCFGWIHEMGLTNQTTVDQLILLKPHLRRINEILGFISNKVTSHSIPTNRYRLPCTLTVLFDLLMTHSHKLDAAASALFCLFHAHSGDVDSEAFDTRFKASFDRIFTDLADGIHPLQQFMPQRTRELIQLVDMSKDPRFTWEHRNNDNQKGQPWIAVRDYIHAYAEVNRYVLPLFQLRRQGQKMGASSRLETCQSSTSSDAANQPRIVESQGANRVTKPVSDGKLSAANLSIFTNKHIVKKLIKHHRVMSSPVKMRLK